MASLRPGSRGLRYDALHCVGGVSIDGDTVLGTDESSLVTVNATLLIRKVDDSGMVATPGIRGEVVFNEDYSKVYLCTNGDPVAATWRSNAYIAGPATIGGDLVCGGTLTVTSDATVSGDLVVNGKADIVGDLTIHGDAALAMSGSNVVACVGAFLPRQVAGPGMANTPGTESEIVYNLADGVAYVCTATDPVAATWAALN